MSVYPPPNFTEFITTFNTTNWESSDETITLAYLNANFLKYPVAQGLETLQAITVNGNADFNSPTTMSKPLTLDGAVNTDRIINNVYYQFQDATSLSTTTAQLYGSAGTMIYDNDALGGSHSFATSTSGGTQTIPLVLSSLNGATITTNNPLSASSSFAVVDSSTTNQLVVIPNVGGGLYNNSVDAGNILLLGTSNAVSTETIQISTWSSTNNYVKVRPTSVGMGAGSSTTTASSSVECNGSTVRIVPSLTFPDNTVQTTAFTGSVAGFLSGMIIQYGGISAPSGFLFCDGSQVSTTTYSGLFAVLGTKYNTTTPTAGNFFLPDFRDRSAIGSASTILTGNILNGGLSNIAYNANIYNGNKTLLANQLASHTHNLAWNTATYIDNVNTTNNTTTGGSGSRAVSGTSSSFPTTSGAPSNFFNFQGQGEYLIPVCAVNFIIKT
jgi:hypothetical protein